MKINVAQHCGFCTGVKNAIALAENALKEYANIAVLGDLVHNKIVMDTLYSKGLVLVSSLDEIQNMPLLLRAHGTDKDLVTEALAKGIVLIDATCPLVLDIHKHAVELEKEGRQVIIIGDHQHDEVLGIRSHLQDPCIISSPQEINDCKLKQKIGVVIQSTQAIKNVQDIVAILLTKSSDCRIINTICQPTRRNQQEIQELAKNNDAILVIGDPNSANSKRLFEVAKSINKKVLLVSKPEDLDERFLQDCQSVGISAGASTPDVLIQDITNKIKHLHRR